MAASKQTPHQDEFSERPEVALLTELGIAAVAVDRGGTIRCWNGFAAALYGRSELEMLGANIDTVHLPEDRRSAARMLNQVLDLGHWYGEAEILDAGGSLLLLDVRATVLLDESRRPSGVIGAFRELDPPAPARRFPRGGSTGTLLDIRQPGPPEWGYWEWDPVNNEGTVSTVLRSLLELDGGPELTMEAAGAAFSATDRAAVEDVYRQFTDGESDTASYAHRIVGPSGDVSFIATHCEAIRSEDGRLLRVRGTTEDVTRSVERATRMEDAAELAQATLDSLSAHVAILDEAGRIIAVNRAWRRFAAEEGATGEFIGADYLASRSPGGNPGMQTADEGLTRVLAGEQAAFELEYPCHSPSQRRWFMLRATRCVRSGRARVVVSHEDVTANHELRRHASAQQSLLDKLNAAVVITDADGAIRDWNDSAEQLYGWSADEAIGRWLLELIDPVNLATGARPETGDRQGRWDGEYRVRRKDGSTAFVHARLQALLDEDGVRTGLASVAVDISERKSFERELLRAYSYLQAVTDSVGEGVFALDRDGRVTYMNDAAEEMLGWSLEQLEGRVMHPITHGRRLDGSDYPDGECPISRAGTDGERVHVNDDLFVRSDGSELPVAYTAAPFATDQGVEGCVVVFGDISARKAAELEAGRDREERSWVARVHDALSEDGFELYGQPIIDLQSGEIVQRELLLRMRPPGGVGKMISPGLFLPAAEASGLIGEVDRWVINRASEIAAHGAPVELNISGSSVSDPNLLDFIRRAIRRTGADPASLVFEITETTLIRDEAAARAFVEGLHRLGCRIALDDFGTGYGGFTYLKQLPIDYIKVDIEFVRDVRYDPASQKVVEAVVNLARGFGLITVGEGVEDEQTLDLLRDLGVDRAQGFHIGRPAPLEAGDTPTTHEEAK